MFRETAPITPDHLVDHARLARTAGSREAHHRCRAPRTSAIELRPHGSGAIRILLGALLEPGDDARDRVRRAARELGEARLHRLTRQLAAFVEQLRPRRTMDRAIDAAATEQAAVGGVDDRVDFECRDVTGA